MKKISLTLFVALLATPAAYAGTYALVDTAGNRTFTDRPASARAAAAPAVAVRASHEQRHAQDSVSPADLAGIWRAQSFDGEHTRLEVRDNGSFVYDSRATKTPQRTYMCGRLEIAGETLSMALSTVKRRDADGVIEQMLGESASEARLLSAGENRLVLRLDGRTMVFTRVVG